MARVRTIKPEFWTDRRVGECSTTARLLFVAALNFADDEGGLDRSAKQLKAQAFPYDNLDCEPLVQELLNSGLMIEYEVGGEKYLHIKNFRKHQRIDKPQKARIPVYESSATIPRTFQESSSTIQCPKGREGKGIEEESKNVLSAAPTTRKPRARTVPRETDPEWLLDFKLAYPNRAGDQGWRRAQRAANERMREGHTSAEFISGARRYAAFCEATGKVGSEYVKQASSFLGPDKPFLLPWHAPPKPENASERILRTLNGGSDNSRVIEHEAELFEPLAIARQ